MNYYLNTYARMFLFNNLSKCNKKQVDLFRRMYFPHYTAITIENMSMQLPDEQLDWAMQQVAKTLDKDKIWTFQKTSIN